MQIFCRDVTNKNRIFWTYKNGKSLFLSVFSLLFFSASSQRCFKFRPSIYLWKNGPDTNGQGVYDEPGPKWICWILVSKSGIRSACLDIISFTSNSSRLLFLKRHITIYSIIVAQNWNRAGLMNCSLVVQLNYNLI